MAEAVDEDSANTSDPNTKNICIIIKTAKEKETIEINENESVKKVSIDFIWIYIWVDFWVDFLVDFLLDFLVDFSSYFTLKSLQMTSNQMI